jgi:hypothetical protein
MHQVKCLGQWWAFSKLFLDDCVLTYSSQCFLTMECCPGCQRVFYNWFCFLQFKRFHIFITTPSLR